MPLKLKKGCKSCSVIREEGGQEKSRLFRLVNDYHLKKITMTALHIEYKDKIGTYLALRNHAMKHQHPSEKVMVAKAAKENRARATYAVATQVRKHQDLTQEIITKVLEGIESGEISVNATQGIQAAKLQADIELKQRDQQIDILKLMASSRSGEFTAPQTKEFEPFDPWKETDGQRTDTTSPPSD